MKKIIPVAVLLLCISLGIGGYFAWYYSPVNRIERAFEAEDYPTVVEWYEKLSKDSDRLDVEGRLVAQAEKEYESYVAEEMTYEEVYFYYEMVSEDILSTNRKMKKYREQLDEVRFSRAVYGDGVSCMEKADYLAAIGSFRMVSELDAVYKEKAEAYIVECENLYCEDIIKKADELIAAEEYKEARDLILGARTHVAREEFEEKLLEIAEYLDVNIDGVRTTTYDLGDLIASELGITDQDIYFPVKMVLGIENGKFDLHVDKDSISPAIDSLTKDKASMDALFAVAEQYGFHKGEVSVLITLMYGGSYSAFIMDQFGDEIQKALDAFRLQEECTVIKAKIYLGADGKENKNYLTYSSPGTVVTFLGYEGEEPLLKQLKYPITWQQ